MAEVREWCSRAYVLCGTPAPNSPHDIIEQFNIADFGYTFDGVSVPDHRDRAVPVVQRAMGQRGLFVRNLKQEVLPLLPDRDFVEVQVQLEPEQRDAYNAALDKLILDLRDTSDLDFRRQLVSFLERKSALLRICSNPSSIIPGYSETPSKLLALDQLVERFVIEEGEKLVVWSFYRTSLDAIAARYAHLGIARIDGSVTKTGHRRDAVRRFQEDEITRIFVGNPAAAGAGLTLHRASTAIYESLSNQTAHFLQSLDRIHRRGQDSSVQYITLLAQDTIELLEYQRLLDKAKRQAELLGDPHDERPVREVLLAELLEARSLMETGRGQT
jgi:SNF2 family DNA or RNA helicase